MSDRLVPARTFPLSARAPGKCVLFGEHSIVHGRPAVLFALDLYTQVGIRPAAETRLNGHAEDARENRYLVSLLDRPGMTPVDVRVVSRIPRGAGLGSSAALCTAGSAALLALDGGGSLPELAQRSFDVERRAQGVGSPGDTSASVAGGYVSVNERRGTQLWEVSDGARKWSVHRLDGPRWAWIVGYSGIPRRTEDAVRAVGERVRGDAGEALLDRFAQVAIEGLGALLDSDRRSVGKCMAENQTLLREVGVSHPRLEELLSAVAPSAEGAKLTGAGAGGSVVVLPKEGREVETSRRIAQAGGVPFIVRASPLGVELIDESTIDSSSQS